MSVQDINNRVESSPETRPSERTATKFTGFISALPRGERGEALTRLTDRLTPGLPRLFSASHARNAWTRLESRTVLICQSLWHFLSQGSRCHPNPSSITLQLRDARSTFCLSLSHLQHDRVRQRTGVRATLPRASKLSPRNTARQRGKRDETIMPRNASYRASACVTKRSRGAQHHYYHRWLATPGTERGLWWSKRETGKGDMERFVCTSTRSLERSVLTTSNTRLRACFPVCYELVGRPSRLV